MMLTQPAALVAVLQPMGAERMAELLRCSVCTEPKGLERCWTILWLVPVMENNSQKALSWGHFRTTDTDFWLSLISTYFKTFSNLCEGLVLLLVETHLEIKKFFNELFAAVQGMAGEQGCMAQCSI